MENKFFFSDKGGPSQKLCTFLFPSSHDTEQYLSAVSLDNKLFYLEGKAASFLKVLDTTTNTRADKRFFPVIQDKPCGNRDVEKSLPARIRA